MDTGSIRDPVVSEFLAHPSFRLVATFFLGLPFITSVHFALYALWDYCRRRYSPRLAGYGLEAGRPDEKVNAWLNANAANNNPVSSSWARQPVPDNICVALTVCFTMATIAHFASLLIFSSSQLGGCAFFVAWSGMAGQCARLLGLIKLSLDMRRLELNRWELYAFWLVTFAAVVIMFVNNSLSVGVLKSVSVQQDMLCIRDRVIGFSAAQSAINIALEFYALLRLVSLIVPWFLSTRHQLDAIMDIRIGRAFSLLVLDIATAAPSAKFFSILADAIPESLAILLVLAVFNHRSPNINVDPTASIPPTHYIESVALGKSPSLNSSVIDIRSNRYSHIDQRVSHPFAAQSLRDPAPETEDWPTSALANLAMPEPAAILTSPTSPRSPKSPSKPRRHTWRSQKRTSHLSTISQSDSDVARSVKGAVVGFAFKDTLQTRHGRVRNSDSSYEPPVVARPVIKVTKSAGNTARVETASRPLPTFSGGGRMPEISVTSETPVSSPKPDISIQVPSARQNRPRPSVVGRGEGRGSSRTSSTTSTSDEINSLRATTGSDVSVQSVQSIQLTPSTPVPLARPKHDSQVTARTTTTEREALEWTYDTAVAAAGAYATSSRRNSQDVQSYKSDASGGAVPLPMPPAEDDLSVVYEESETTATPAAVPLSLRRGVPRPTTFGEGTFAHAGGNVNVLLHARDGERYPFVEQRGVSVPPEGVPEDVHGSSGSLRSRREE